MMESMEPAVATTLSPVDETRIAHLVTLLADENPNVGDTISEHLRAIGPAALSALQTAAGDLDMILSERASGLVREMMQVAVIDDLTHFVQDGAVGLETGLLLLARLESPQLDLQATVDQLDRMTEDLMLRLDPGDEVEVLLKSLARYLHEEQGFGGNVDDYYNPYNTYLHTVLTSRRGIPISLSCLYLVLGQRLGLPLYGVGLPGHFVLKYDDGDQMRVIDPFHRGRLLNREGCNQLLSGLGMTFDERYLDAVNTRYIMERSLKNLIAIYADKGHKNELHLHRKALDTLRIPSR